MGNSVHQEQKGTMKQNSDNVISSLRSSPLNFVSEFLNLYNLIVIFYLSWRIS